MSDQMIKNQAETFAREQRAFDAAKNKYHAALKKFKAFAPQDQLSYPPLQRTAYSDRTAWIMAVMAKLAYIPFEEGEDKLAHLEYNLKSGFSLINVFSQESTQAFLAKNDSFAVLAFRGTEPKKISDVMADIRVYKKTTKEGRVHAGFHGAYQDVAEQVEKSLIKQEWPLYITGHSLGGALATVATQDLDQKYRDLISACYTFGSPRVGNRKFERSVKAPFYRLVNSTDIVTLVPNIGYAHIGDTRYLGRNRELYLYFPFFRRLWEVLQALVIPIHWGRWIACHSMDEYIHKLEDYALKRNK